MKPNNHWLPFAVLAVALVIWASVFAAGAYLEIGVDTPPRPPQAAHYLGHHGDCSFAVGIRPLESGGKRSK